MLSTTSALPASPTSNPCTFKPISSLASLRLAINSSFGGAISPSVTRRMSEFCHSASRETHEGPIEGLVDVGASVKAAAEEFEQTLETGGVEFKLELLTVSGATERVQVTRALLRSALAHALEHHGLGDGFSGAHHRTRRVEAHDDRTALRGGSRLEALDRDCGFFGPADALVGQERALDATGKVEQTRRECPDARSTISVIGIMRDKSSDRHNPEVCSGSIGLRTSPMGNP